MIAADGRTRLREALTQLVDGQMTNNEFDELYYSGWKESPDRGVAAIAHFGWSLYSSDLPLPYRLNGRYAVMTKQDGRPSDAFCFLERMKSIAGRITPRNHCVVLREDAGAMAFLWELHC
jgi:hypothetical protein